MDNNQKNPFSNFKKIKLDPEKKLAMRSELVKFIKTPSLVARPTPVKSPFLQFISNTQRAFVVLVVVAGVLGVIKSFEGSKIGDMLYPVKIYLADPINDILKSEATDTTIHLNQDLEKVSPENSTGVDITDTTETGIESPLNDTGESLDENQKTMLFEAKPASEEVDRPLKNESIKETTETSSLQSQGILPSAIIDESSIFILPSAGDLSGEAMSESERIKVINPNKNVLAHVGGKLEIDWKINLAGVKDGTKNMMTIYLQNASSDTMEPIKLIIIAKDIKVSEEGSYIWEIPDIIESGRYQIYIHSDDEVSISGTSEEFKIVKESL